MFNMLNMEYWQR